MRSGQLIASNDDLITEFINSDNYIIQRDGTILTKITTNGKGIMDTWRELYIYHRDGYKFVGYKSKRLSVHRIMYAKFNGPLEKDLMINHIDGNHSNNVPENLELVTQKVNNIHRFQTLGHKAVYGNTKLSFEIADEIREKKRQGKTHKELCEEYKISKGHVSEIVNNKIWVRE